MSARLENIGGTALDELQLRIYEQRTVTQTLVVLFELCGDHAEGGAHVPVSLWEGLVVICRNLDRDLEAISKDAEDLVPPAAAGGRRRDGGQ